MNQKPTDDFKEHTGLREIYRSFGRIQVEIICPFCDAAVRAFLWSLAGSGKRCECGAVLGQTGAFKKRPRPTTV